MNKSLFVFLLLFVFHFVNCQKIDPKKLDDEISALNNKKQYNLSIVKLEDIINGKGYTPYDKYNAYLQKSFTYKRLYDHSGAMDNLNNALDIGMQSDRKDEVETRILVEKLFIAFDLLHYDDVDRYLSQVKSKNLDLIDDTTHAFFISLLAVHDMRNGQYEEAERKLDKSILLLEKSNPKDLPNIYRKKISLYGDMKKPELVKEAFEKGMYYAEKYQTDLYKIVMYESLTAYYLQNEDYKNAFECHKNINILRTEYNHVSLLGELNILEKGLLQKRKDMEIEYEKKLNIFFILLLIVTLVLIFVLYKLYLSNRQRRILTENENSRMRSELERFINSDKKEEINIDNGNLSERQLEIIDLVKQHKTNKEIGNQLHISENTVKYHLKIIYNVLGIENRLELKQ